MQIMKTLDFAILSLSVRQKTNEEIVKTHVFTILKCVKGKFKVISALLPSEISMSSLQVTTMI